MPVSCECYTSLIYLLECHIMFLTFLHLSMSVHFTLIGAPHEQRVLRLLIEVLIYTILVLSILGPNPASTKRWVVMTEQTWIPAGNLRSWKYGQE